MRLGLARVVALIGRIDLCFALIACSSSVVFANEASAGSGQQARVRLPPHIADQFRQYLPQIREFVAFNVAGLRNNSLLLQQPPVFRFSNLRGISESDMSLVRSNLAYFGVDAASSGGKPNFLFATPESASDLHRMLIDLGFPKQGAGVEASVYLSSPWPCYLVGINPDISGRPEQLVLAVARAQSTMPTPAVCLNNTVLNALGLSKSLEQFTPVQAGPLSRFMDEDFVTHVTECKVSASLPGAIADCVAASYSFLQSE